MQQFDSYNSLFTIHYFQEQCTLHLSKVHRRYVMTDKDWSVFESHSCLVPQVKCTFTCIPAAAGVKHGAHRITAGSVIYLSNYIRSVAYLWERFMCFMCRFSNLPSWRWV